jgi:ketosteroid isomerase-like protein
VAFATAVGHWINTERNGDETNLKFRLRMGFRKHGGRWRIVHEHHSLPAADQIPE